MSELDKKADDYITESENLNDTLKVVYFKAWIGIVFFLLITAAILIWSVTGKIPITVTGNCILSDPEAILEIRSPSLAVVKEVRAITGNEVQEGDVLIILESISELGQAGEVKQTAVTAPDPGSIYLLNVGPGLEVQPGQLLLSIHKHISPTTIRMLAFIPIFAGQQVEPGMTSRMSFGSFQMAKYGMIEGKVSEVLPYTADLDNYFIQEIPSESMREFLTEGKGKPFKIILIEPNINLKNPTGMEWTKGSGPPTQLLPGQLGFIQIELESIKPISYVFPSKVLKEGK